MKPCLLWALLFLLLSGLLYCQPAAYNEMVGVRNAFNLLAQGFSDDPGRTAYLRWGWKPELELRFQPFSGIDISGDICMDNSVSASFGGNETAQDIDLQIYRAWVSISTQYTSLRGGLQYIQFGPARILRPLQWFDSLDPADLFAATKGVKGILLSQYFPNPNLRLWVIQPDEDLPLNLMMPGKKDTPELGGRLELHTTLGDTGISLHNRILEAVSGADSELRVGLDHRMDAAIGTWVEASAALYRDPAPQLPTASLSATLGCDYTIPAANGIYLLTEHNLLADTTTGVGELHSRKLSSAIMASYPSGLLDSFSLLGSWDWTESRGVATLAWRRVYDYLSWELGATFASRDGQASGTASGIHLKVALEM